MGIGGEYAAIDGLLPARVRGWTDLAINGSYRIGTIIGDAATLVLLDPNVIPPQSGLAAVLRTGRGAGLRDPAGDRQCARHSPGQDATDLHRRALLGQIDQPVLLPRPVCQALAPDLIKDD